MLPIQNTRRIDRLFLFDVDGTLTEPRKAITAEVAEFLTQLRQVGVIGIVGGSDLSKQREQLGNNLHNDWDYIFSENGLVAYKGHHLLAMQSLKDLLGEDRIKKFVNFVLRYLSEIDIPVKRGTFIEFRSGMINISPIGRNCTQSERDAFEQYDKKHAVRETMINVLKGEFNDYNLIYSVGGQISFDVFRREWDKTYCLRYLEEFKEVHFFGDKTMPGGNDYELYVHHRVIGHSVKNPDDMMQQVTAILGGQPQAPRSYCSN